MAPRSSGKPIHGHSSYPHLSDAHVPSVRGRLGTLSDTTSGGGNEIRWPDRRPKYEKASARQPERLVGYVLQLRARGKGLGEGYARPNWPHRRHRRLRVEIRLHLHHHFEYKAVDLRSWLASAPIQ